MCRRSPSNWWRTPGPDTPTSGSLFPLNVLLYTLTKSIRYKGGTVGPRVVHKDHLTLNQLCIVGVQPNLGIDLAIASVDVLPQTMRCPPRAIGSLNIEPQADRIVDTGTFFSFLLALPHFSLLPFLPPPGTLLVRRRK